MKQSDLRVANIAGVRQAIVYDEGDRWPSSGLAQLNLAQVPVISAVMLEQGLRAALQQESVRTLAEDSNSAAPLN